MAAGLIKIGGALVLWFVACFVVVLLSGCHERPDPSKMCAWVRPIYISRQDMVCMSRGTKQQVLTHNETWAKTQ